MSKRIPEETKQRAIRLVLDHLDEYPNLTSACEAVSTRLWFGAESLRRWVRQAQIDGGQRQRQGLTSSESERMRRLERENRELREANAILRDAAVFFAGELDPDATDPRVHRGAARKRPLGQVDLPGSARPGRACRRADIPGMEARPVQRP
ncbi:MAG: transposase [Pseudoclavibacter sp.]